jgi:hypothetical protein
LQHLRNGDGPAYFGLYTPSLDHLEAALESAGQPFRREGLLLPSATGQGWPRSRKSKGCLFDK